MTKVTIIRVTGEGEQITVEAEVPKPTVLAGGAAIHKFLQATVYEAMDMRLRESAGRLLNAMGFERQVPENIRHASMLITKCVLDLIYGRTQGMVPVPQDVLDEDKKRVADAVAQAQAEGVQIDPAVVEPDNVIVGPWVGSNADEDGDEA